MAKAKKLTPSEAQIVPPAYRDEVAEMRAVFNAVEVDKPKPEDVQRLRDLLKKYPTMWTYAGDLMQQAQHQAIQNVNAGKQKTLLVESVEEGMQNIRRQLDYAGAPMLEKLLIEQIVTAWLRLGICEMQFSNRMGGELTLAQGDYWNRALDAAQRRYLRAIESLARVRRLKLPALQVNVAQPGAKQLNVATSAKAKSE